MSAVRIESGLIVLGLLLLTGPPLGAEPRTLYKERNLQTARQNAARYPWAKAIVDGWRSRAKTILAHDRAWLDALVPELTPGTTYGQNCPACVGKQSSMGETGLYRWDINQPDQLTCKYCQTVYPNERYPETGRLDCPRMGQSFTYYLTDEERAHPGDVSGKYAYRWASWPVHTSWSGVIRANRASWVAGQILPLAQLYAVTGEVAYGERSVWCLDALARAWPNWLYHSYNGTVADCPPAEAALEMGRNPRAGKFPKEVIRSAFPHLVDANKDGFGELNVGFWGAGRLSCGAGGEGSLLFDCAVAYDLLRDATYPDGRPLLAGTERERIERDLLLAGAADWLNYRDINNKCGPSRAFAGAIAILFDRPDQARFALEGFERLLGEAFHFDGFCRESPSYSNMHLGLMADIPEVLAGYSDPAGYQPATGAVLKDFDPYQHVPRYRLALESMVRMLAPDGKCPVIGDTHVGTGVSAEYAEILTARYGPTYAPLLETALRAKLAEKGSVYALFHRDPDLTVEGAAATLPLRTEWFPGWRVGVLRGGLGPTSPTALYLNGYEYHGHRHDDTLGLIYYDHGRELLSDRGYIWDDPRNAWTKSTLSHNLVTVDGQGQGRTERASKLELFGAGPEVEVVQASANAYAQCSEYRRATALVRVSPTQTYAVDLFRVRGGQTHQYGVQGNGQLASLDGPVPTPLEGKLSWLFNLRERRPAAAGWRAEWLHQGVRTQVHLLSDADRLILADAPGWRSYKGDQLNAPPIQQVLAERRGENLASRFVALLVPYQVEASPVKAARVIAATPADEAAVAVEIQLADRTDYVLYAQDTAPRRYGPLELAGRFGYLSVRPDGTVRAGYLLAGTRLKLGEFELTLPAATTTRAVKAIAGQTIELTEPLPAGVAAGDLVLAATTGLEVAAVDGARLTIRDYPPPVCEQVEVLHAARRGPEAAPAR